MKQTEKPVCALIARGRPEIIEINVSAFVRMIKKNPSWSDKHHRRTTNAEFVFKKRTSSIKTTKSKVSARGV